ncbi:hypothetical protein QVD17_08123 [Tagetes erecta]|uniref:C-JID domain-containing protein n=1 Tax=Tagetes erecta TaxID=13708 RepID=A0AAD8KXR8_TARER|nr:hypothetical protein QVD17_08123 [Tagetes erecta]
MHDLVQEMGHYIVRGELPPAKHSRVWKHEDIKEICSGDEILENDTIEAIRFTNECDYSLPIVIFQMSYAIFIGLHILQVLSQTLFYQKKLVVLKLDFGIQRELWMGDQDLPHLKVLQLSHMRKLISTPDFNGLPRLQELRLYHCKNLEEIHPSLENCTSLERLYVYGSKRLNKLPTFSQMKSIKCLIIRACWLKERNKPCGIGLLSNLQELDLSSNWLSQLDFSLSQLTQLKCLVLSRSAMLRELPKLPSSLAILKAPSCEALTIDEDFNKDCKELCQVTLKCGWSNKLLQSMLKGNAFENGSMHLRLTDLEIPKGFTPPLLRGSSCRLKLPENWCNDFSGFLMCMVVSLNLETEDGTIISMKQLSGMDFEDDVVWEESDGDSRKYQTWVWYVSFGSLRRTIWWDHTYKALDFNIQDKYRERPAKFGVGDDIQRPVAFGVRLVEKKSNSDLTSTSTMSSSHYAPRIKIQYDSASALTVKLHMDAHHKNITSLTTYQGTTTTRKSWANGSLEKHAFGKLRL